MTRKLLVLLALLSISFSVSALQDDTRVDYKKQYRERVKQFKELTGFKGTINKYFENKYKDSRILKDLRGTFPLPEPVDTVIFRQNCQKISEYIRNLYITDPDDSCSWYLQADDKVIELKWYDEFHFSFYQYYNGFEVWEHLPLGIVISDPGESVRKFLSITYSFRSKKYRISNQLRPDKIALGKPMITEQQALDNIYSEARKQAYLDSLETQSEPKSSIVAGNLHIRPPRNRHLSNLNSQLKLRWKYFVPPPSYDIPDHVSWYNYGYIYYFTSPKLGIILVDGTTGSVEYLGSVD